MHLAILTQYYPPEVGAPQARLSEMAAHFIECGHRVTVLTAMPNYPTGRIHVGFGGWLRRECLQGVDVIRTLLYPTQRTDFAHRLTSYFSFVCSSMAVGTACLPCPDYVLVESPPLFLGLSGFWLSRLKRARLIFNVSDLWPESAVSLGLLRREGWAHRLSASLEAFCYRRAWLITGQSKSIVADIASRFPERPVLLLSNGVDTCKFGPDCRTEEARAALAAGAGCIVLFAGLHGLAQGLDQILAAAGVMRNDTNLCFTLVGDGPEKRKLIAQAEAAGLSNVRFLDPYPAREMPALVAAADIALVTIKNDMPGMVPVKLYEAMASAIPVVLVARGEAARIVRDHHAGLTVVPGDIAGLVKALRILRANPELRHTMGINGRRTVETLFDRTKIVSGFREHLERNLFDLRDKASEKCPQDQANLADG